jgi:hypothetical protein
MKLIAEAWKEMSKEEQQPYADIATKSKEETLREWNSREPEREKKRKSWCEKLKLPIYASWETIDEANKKLFIRENGVEVKKKRKTSDEEDSRSSDSSDEGGSGVHGGRDKTTRTATMVSQKLQDRNPPLEIIMLTYAECDEEIERKLFRYWL